jgi:2-methylcitrate dehydratase PrpD
MIIHGGVGTQTYTEEAIGDPAVAALAQRVRYEVRDFPSPFGGAVRARLTDGSELAAQCPYPAGAPENPLDDAAVIAKFRDNAALVLPESDVVALQHAVEALEESPGLTAIARPLARAARLTV